jgi:hypothetical protein
MFIADPPHLPAEQAPAPVRRPVSVGTIGICHLAENPSEPDNAANMLSVFDEAKYYFTAGHRQLSGPVTARILRPPRHGRLVDTDSGLFTYRPDAGYRGKDRITILAASGGKTLRMEYFVHVMEFVPADDQEPDEFSRGYCPVKARTWRIISPSGTATSRPPQ